MHLFKNGILFPRRVLLMGKIFTPLVFVIFVFISNFAQAFEFEFPLEGEIVTAGTTLQAKINLGDFPIPFRPIKGSQPLNSIPPPLLSGRLKYQKIITARSPSGQSYDVTCPSPILPAPVSRFLSSVPHSNSLFLRQGFFRRSRTCSTRLES